MRHATSNLSSTALFFFKQKTAYEMRISDWSSDVCSSDLAAQRPARAADGNRPDRMAELGCRSPGAFVRCLTTAHDPPRPCPARPAGHLDPAVRGRDRKSTRLNSSH